MSDRTDFAAWQARLGLSRVADVVKVLPLTRRSVERLRTGEQQPHPCTQALMNVCEEFPAVTNWLRRRSITPPSPAGRAASRR